MAVKYVLTKRGNPSDPDAPKKVYAQAKSDGEVTLKKLGKELAEGSTTVSDTDALAVLNELIKLLNRHCAFRRLRKFSSNGFERRRRYGRKISRLPNQGKQNHLPSRY